MTSIIDALVFPHTRLNTALMPLTLVFRPALLRPVEDASGCSLPAGPCQAILPPPLGNHLPRFESLVADITAKGEAEAMSRLLLGGKSQAGRYGEDETSRHLAKSIMAAHGGMATDGAAQADDLLWNERLLLTLAEFLDDEEAGVNEGWQRLDDRYRRTLAELRGDDDPALPPPRQIMAAGPHLAARLKAWSRLYFASDAPPMPLWACLEAVADELFELRTTRSGDSAAAVLLGEIALPSRLDEKDGDRLTEFAELAAQLAELLANINDQPGDFPAFADAWRQKLDASFPGGGRGRLRFYDLGALPAGTALGGRKRLASSGRILAVWRPMA